MKLPTLDGQQRARFRFRLYSDLAVTGDGWYLDDIRLVGHSAETDIIAPGSNPAPTMTGLNPAYGSLSGGTLVTITGSDFTPATTLAFGNTLVTPTFISPQELRVSSPSATTTGTVNFLLSNGNFSNVWENAFTYSNTQLPQVELRSPTGTSVLYLGSRIAIRWRSSDDRSISHKYMVEDALIRRLRLHKQSPKWDDATRICDSIKPAQ